MSIRLETAFGSSLPYATQRFSGGERHVQLDDWTYALNECAAKAKHLELDLTNDGRDIVIIRANLHNSNDVMDLLLICDAIKWRMWNVYKMAPKLYIEIPYLPYARQDRVCAEGQAFSSDVFGKMLSHLIYEKGLVVWDVHSQASIAGTLAVNVPAEDILLADDQYLAAQLLSSDAVLICPDSGAVPRTASLAKAVERYFGVGDGTVQVAHCTKIRDPLTGNITGTWVDSSDLDGKDCIITDDICDGGYTFIKIAEILKAHGAASVKLYVTHGIFSKGLDVFDGLIDEIWTTNSFPQLPHPKLNIIKYAYNFRKHLELKQTGVTTK